MIDVLTDCCRNKNLRQKKGFLSQMTEIETLKHNQDACINKSAMLCV